MQKNLIDEVGIREDASFIWEEFKVVLERCSLKSLKVALYAIRGEVNTRYGKISASESSPQPIAIPYGMVGDILRAIEKNRPVIVYSHNYYQPEFFYIYTDPRHGG